MMMKTKGKQDEPTGRKEYDNIAANTILVDRFKNG